MGHTDKAGTAPVSPVTDCTVPYIHSPDPGATALDTGVGPYPTGRVSTEEEGTLCTEGSHVRPQGEGRPLQGLARSQPQCRLDLVFPVSRTVRQCMFAASAPVQVSCRSRVLACSGLGDRTQAEIYNEQKCLPTVWAGSARSRRGPSQGCFQLRPVREGTGRDPLLGALSIMALIHSRNTSL